MFTSYEHKKKIINSPYYLEHYWFQRKSLNQQSRIKICTYLKF